LAGLAKHFVAKRSRRQEVCLFAQLQRQLSGFFGNVLLRFAFHDACPHRQMPIDEFRNLRSARARVRRNCDALIASFGRAAQGFFRLAQPVDGFIRSGTRLVSSRDFTPRDCPNRLRDIE
jgi:hypothetical protein